MKSSKYREAGVDLSKYESIVNKIKKLMGDDVQTGHFGGFFPLNSKTVLVSSIDGVGTKLIVARMAKKVHLVGKDLVNHCVNDILATGATPLFFMDYIASSLLNEKQVIRIIDSIKDACKENEVALVGGETAEMPGIYNNGEWEIVGAIVGIVESDKILGKHNVKENNILVGLPSTGLHTNGYSLARKIVFDKLGYSLNTKIRRLNNKSVEELLLVPHISYRGYLQEVLQKGLVGAIAHITGGGITGNLVRVLPHDLDAVIYLGSWEIPPIFTFLKEKGEIEDEEMFTVFNMGIGMILVVDPENLSTVLNLLKSRGMKGEIIGRITKGRGKVIYDYPKKEF